MCMTLMEDPSKRFGGEVITRIEDTRAESHEDVTIIFPILNCEALNVNVPGAFRGYLLGIDHVDSGLVIFIDGSRSRRRKAKVSKDG